MFNSELLALPEGNMPLSETVNLLHNILEDDEAGISWTIWVRQWEGWHPIYEMENNPHVPNHQPDFYVESLQRFHQIVDYSGI